MVSNAFYANEIERELRDRDGSFHFPTLKVNCKAVKKFIEERRVEEVYGHDCGDEGKQRGCPYLNVMDCVWKVCYRHCAMKLERTININHVTLPPICDSAPQCGSLYCLDHQKDAIRMALPLTKQESIIAAMGQQQSEEEYLYSTEMFPDFELNPSATTDLTCQNKEVVAPWCKKNLGSRKKVGCWSRGLFVFVNGCGHISSFSPLYQSESMSQVFVIIMMWLHKCLQQLDESEWNNFFLCYDNMCNFARPKVLREPLPAGFDEPYQSMWKKISKIIDGLHLQNHKRESCKVDFNPGLFAQAHPGVLKANTMAAEQASSWLTKYKKQLNAMSKDNQLSFLHRLITRRNEYNAKRLRGGESPTAHGPRNRLERAGY